MLESVRIVGRGRVGNAVTARLSERGVAVRHGEVDLVLLCVPDRAIAEAARAVEGQPIHL